MTNMKTIVKLILLSAIIILTGWILYFTRFSRGFSIIASDWADFATFNNYFLSIVSLIILGSYFCNFNPAKPAAEVIANIKNHNSFL